MNTKIVRTLYKKELTDILRDTKTIIVMVLVPLVLYPLLFFGSFLLSSSIITQSVQKEYKVAVVSEFPDASAKTKKLLADSLDDKEYHFAVSDIESNSDFEALVRNAEYDLIIKPESNDELFDVTIYCMNAKVDSATSSSMAEEVFKDFSKETVEQKLRDVLPDYDEITKEPFEIKTENFATKEESTGMIIGYIMPFFMIVSVLMGSFTIAIDVSVGERERGTLETLLTLPVSNLEMMLAKFLSVATIGVGSVLLNAASFVVMGLFVGNSLKIAGTVFGGFDIAMFIPSLLLMLPLVILFTMFVSAICLCVDFTAKSVKEANNLTTPILLVFMLSAAVAIIPYIKLDYKWALVPIVNVTLLIKELFMLDFKANIIAIVFFSTLLYTVIAIFVMTKLFSSEDILFGEGVRSFRLFEKRANMKKGQIPGAGDICFLFALIFILSNYIGTGVMAKNGIWGVAVGQFVMLIVPILYAWYIKADLKKLFSIEKPRIAELVGALFFMIGLTLLLNPLLIFLINTFPSLGEENESLSNLIGNAPFATSLFVVGILPALAEEVTFRGFLFGSLINKKKIPVWAACVITAVVFAAYHMNLYQFIYVTILGLFMSYMIYNSKSIFVTALFHFLTNSTSVCFGMVPWFGEHLPFLNISEYDAQSLISTLLVGTACVAVGFFVSDRKMGIFRKR